MNLEDLKKVLSDISKVPIEDIHDDSSLKNDLNIDSLQMVNLIVKVSEEYGVDIKTIQSLDDIRTVEKMYRTLLREDDK